MKKKVALSPPEVGVHQRPCTRLMVGMQHHSGPMCCCHSWPKSEYRSVSPEYPYCKHFLARFLLIRDPGHATAVGRHWYPSTHDDHFAASWSLHFWTASTISRSAQDRLRSPFPLDFHSSTRASHYTLRKVCLRIGRSCKTGVRARMICCVVCISSSWKKTAFRELFA